MSTDELVSRDLATTAAANRGNARTLADTLRAVGAVRAPVAAGTPDAPLRWLVLGEIYASRVARTWTGAAALVSLLAVLSFNAAKTLHLLHYDAGALGSDPVTVGVFLLACLFLVRIVARGLAARAFARAAATSGGAERMVSASDRWALWLGVAGPFAFALVFGVAYFVLRRDPLDYFACALDGACWGDTPDAVTYTHRLRDLAVLVPLGIAGAFALARRPPAGRIVRAAGIVAGLVLAVTLVVGLRFDEGPWPENLGDTGYIPSPVLRQILAITGSIGLFGVLAALALWLRASENERIATTSS